MKKKNKKHFNPWYKNEEIEGNLVEVSTNLIILTEHIHKTSAVHLTLNEAYKNTVVINPLPDGNYSLAVGFNAFCRAKLLDAPVLAYITTDSREDFIAKYKIPNMPTKQK